MPWATVRLPIKQPTYQLYPITYHYCSVCRYARLFTIIFKNRNRSFNVRNENGSSCQSLPNLRISALHERCSRIFREGKFPYCTCSNPPPPPVCRMKEAHTISLNDFFLEFFLLFFHCPSWTNKEILFVQFSEPTHFRICDRYLIDTSS